MSVLIFIEANNGQLKKPDLEAASYGAQVASMLGVEANAMVFNNSENLESLGNYGIKKVFKISDNHLANFDARVYAKSLLQIVSAQSGTAVIFSHSFTGKAVAPYLAGMLKASLVAGAISLPKIEGNNWLVKKNVFSGKAFAHCKLSGSIKIISLLPNSVAPQITGGTAVVENFPVTITDDDCKVKVKEVVKASGKIPLTEADIIVSGGRGLKGPENWGMLEEMADILGAALACSRAVSDVHWRPHSEHVGQTGLTVRPNLYIAVGISGAIQHLAGVNGSKVMVVINKDPEAPFFKAADYGIVGDAFEVVPKLNAALRKFKQGA